MMRMRQMKQVEEREMQKPGAALGGLSGWVLNRLRGLNIGRARRKEPRLAVIERIALAPRQSLALVEAEGRRFLLATSADGTPAFCPLQDTQAVGDQSARTNGPVQQQLKDGAGRDAKVVAW